eukprot:GSA120T00005546001.1
MNKIRKRRKTGKEEDSNRKGDYKAAPVGKDTAQIQNQIPASSSASAGNANATADTTAFATKKGSDANPVADAAAVGIKENNANPPFAVVSGNKENNPNQVAVPAEKENTANQIAVPGNKDENSAPSASAAGNKVEEKQKCIEVQVERPSDGDTAVKEKAAPAIPDLVGEQIVDETTTIKEATESTTAGKPHHQAVEELQANQDKACARAEEPVIVPSSSSSFSSAAPLSGETLLPEDHTTAKSQSVTDAELFESLWNAKELSTTNYSATIGAADYNPSWMGPVTMDPPPVGSCAASSKSVNDFSLSTPTFPSFPTTSRHDPAASSFGFADPWTVGSQLMEHQCFPYGHDASSSAPHQTVEQWSWADQGSADYQQPAPWEDFMGAVGPRVSTSGWADRTQLSTFPDVQRVSNIFNDQQSAATSVAPATSAASATASSGENAAEEQPASSEELQPGNTKTETKESGMISAEELQALVALAIPKCGEEQRSNSKTA